MEWLAQMRCTWLEHTIAGLDWVTRRRGRADSQPAHLVTGIDGEDAAFFYLRRQGYIVVARRWASGDVPGDIDLIAWHGPMLCFVEVKTRTARDTSPAEIAVDSHKRDILRRLARRYLRQLTVQPAPQVRFDVISVYLVQGQEKEFVHFESAFGWSEYRRL
jgi:putative endonuclease